MNAAEVEVIVSQIEDRKGKAVVQDDGDDDDDGWGELLIEGDSYQLVLFIIVWTLYMIGLCV